MSLKAKIFTVVAVVLVVGGVGGYFGLRQVLRHRVAGWKVDGIAASKAGDDAKAADLLFRYLNRQPDDPAALEAYAKSRELVEEANGQHIGMTVQALRRLIGLEPNRMDLRGRLMELYFHSERRPEALDMAAAILSAKKDHAGEMESGPPPEYDPDKGPAEKDPAELHKIVVAALRVRTEALDALRQYHEALASAEEWAATEPTDVRAHLDRIKISSELGLDKAAIIGNAAELAEKHPGEARFELVLGAAYATTKDNKQAEKYLQRAAAHPDLTEEVAKPLVQELDRAGLPRASLAVMQAMGTSGHSPVMRDMLAKRLWEMGDFAGVGRVLAGYDPTAPSADPTLVAMQAVAAHATKDAGVEQRCRAALAARKQTAAARAWAGLLRRELDGAAVDDKQVAADCRTAAGLDPENAYLCYELGESYVRLGELDLATAAWEQAVAGSPTWWRPTVRLVDVLLQRGRATEALREVWPAVSRPNMTLPVAVSLCRAWAGALEVGTMGRPNDLLKLVTDVQTYQPGEGYTLAIRAQLLAAEGGPEGAAEAKALIRAALDGRVRPPATTGPTTTTTALLAAPTTAGTGSAAAAAVATTAPAVPPLTEQQWITLAAVSRRHRLGLSGECYAKSEQVHGLSPALALAEANDASVTAGTAAAAAGSDNAAAGSAAAAAGLKAFDDLAARGGKAQDREWRMARATFMDGVGHPDALAAWAKLSGDYAKDVGVQEAVLAARAPRTDRALQEKVIDTLKSMTGDGGVAWRLAKARLLVDAPRDAGDAAQASVLLERLTREQPKLAEARALFGRALVQMKRTDAAVEQLRVAVLLDPGSVPVSLELARLLQSRGDYDDASKQLTRVVPLMRTAADRRSAAVLYAQMGRIDDATKLLEQAGGGGGGAGVRPAAAAATTAPTTRPVEDMLLLADLYRQQKDYAKADAMVERMLAAGEPTLPVVNFASSYYTSRGQLDRAEKVLALLDGMKLPVGAKDLMLASHYVQAGNMRKAEGAYQAVTEQLPGNAMAWRMLASTRIMLGRVAEGITTVTAAAKAVPSDESFKKLAESEALLRDAAAGDPSAPPVIMAAVREPAATGVALKLLQVMADWRTSNDSERAAGQFQRLLDENPAFVQARVQLIQCYRSMGRWNDAILVAQKASTAFPTDPAPAQMTAELCASAGQWDLLRQAAETWRKRAPTDQVQIDVLLAGADVAQKAWDTAIRRLAPYVEQATANPSANAQVLSLYVVAENNAGRPGPATAAVWAEAAKSAGWRMRCVQLGQRIENRAWALDWLDRAAALVPAAAAAEERLAVAEAYDAVAAAHQEDAAATAKAAAVYDQLLAQPKPLPAALLSAAIRAERLHDDAAAERLYRRVLDAVPSNWLAQNNLAMVLLRQGRDLPKAQELAAGAVKAVPRMAAVRDTLAAAEFKAGDAKAAVGNIQVAILVDPDNIYWRVRLARYLLAAGDRIQASTVANLIDDRRLDMPTVPKEAKSELDAVRKELSKDMPKGT